MSLGLSAAAWTAIGAVGAPIVGGLLGSQPTTQTQNTQKTLDPRMVPYIFGGNGQKGLLDYGAAQLAQSQSPQGQAGWQQMMSRGQSLMGGSVAGNPFASGYTGGGNLGLAGTGTVGNGIPQYAPPPPAAAPPPAAVQPPAPTLDDILAEIKRRSQPMDGSGWNPDLGNYGGGGY